MAVLPHFFPRTVDINHSFKRVLHSKVIFKIVKTACECNYIIFLQKYYDQKYARELRECAKPTMGFQTIFIFYDLCDFAQRTAS